MVIWDGQKAVSASENIAISHGMDERSVSSISMWRDQQSVRLETVVAVSVFI